MNMINAYKGIAPGKIIASCLRNTNITQRDLANTIGEHFQTINAIIKGKRAMTIPVSLKLDKALNFEQGFFAVIQTYYLIGQNDVRSTRKRTPHIRKYVFWDIDPEKLDWSKNKEFIIQRVYERGNASEIKAIDNYYGKD